MQNPQPLFLSTFESRNRSIQISLSAFFNLHLSFWGLKVYYCFNLWMICGNLRSIGNQWLMFRCVTTYFLALLNCSVFD